jgi:hypothetical protein
MVHVVGLAGVTPYPTAKERSGNDVTDVSEQKKRAAVVDPKYGYATGWK